MSGRDLVGVAALAAAAYGLWRHFQANPPGTPQSPSTAVFPAFSFTWPGGGSDYEGKTIARESGGNPAAKNPRSSASGLYQFTKATWLRLGGSWGGDPTKPFGGLAVSIDEQRARFNQLTGQNTEALRRAGIAVTNATLYAAHFLGAPTAVRVLAAPTSTSLAALVGSDVMRRNPHLAGFTVGDFRRWLETKA